VLPAPTIVLISRGGLPLTPAATFLLDLMHKATRLSGRKPPGADWARDLELT